MMQTPRFRWRRAKGRLTWWRVCLALAEIYLGVMVLGWLVSDFLIFRPPPPTYLEGHGFYRVASSGGARIGMLAVTNAVPARLAVLYFHGNGEDLGGVARGLLEDFRARGVDAYALDYRGYGISDGRPSTAAALADGEAAFQYLVRDCGVPPERIVLYCHSLGAGVALDVAARHRVGGVIVESAFVTAFRVRTHWPLFPLDKLRNNRRIREVHSPVLIIHGERDGMIPAWHGRELYRLASEPKYAYWAPTAGHNDICDSNPAAYWRQVDAFLETVAKPAR